MDIRFDGKTVLITGASTGIGAAMAVAFGTSGAQVAIHYNKSEAEAKAVAEEIKVKKGAETLLVKADVLKPAEIESMVKTVIAKFGRIDILVNNAGGLLTRYPIDEMPDEEYAKVMDLNITSTFRVCKLVIPYMKKSGGGNIINISSLAARNGGGGNAVIYATSKAAVSTFTRGLAKEVAPFKIRVNAIAPGIILTPFHDKYTESDRLQKMIGDIPLGRGATAEEAAGPAVFLASDRLSSFITGEVIEVNGGALMA
jgi:3-oxoacyl-[acyl-carrier protein] reductase